MDYRLWIVELIYVYSIAKEMVLNEYVDQKVSAPLTDNGLPRRTSRLLSHFMKQDSSGNCNRNESSITKWTIKLQKDGSSLIVIWIWRREERTSTSSSVDGVNVNRYYVIL